MAYPTAAHFTPEATTLVGASITTVDTTQQWALGTRCRARDVGSDAAGEAEYIYLKGVASTAAGDVVVYDPKGATTVRLNDDVSGGIGLVAVAMAATVGSTYGWYAIFGAVPVLAGSVAAGAAVYMTSTLGQIDDAVVTGDLITGMFTQSTDSGSFAYCLLAYPFVYQAVPS